MYRKHSPVLGQPIFAARMAAYVSAKSAYNANPKILALGLKAIWDGWMERLS
jgi:hypothetical protein